MSLTDSAARVFRSHPEIASLATIGETAPKAPKGHEKMQRLFNTTLRATKNPAASK
jgi:hypothetical protein